VAAAPVPSAGSGTTAALATHRELIDLGRGQDGPNALRGTKREVVVRLSAATAASIGVTQGESVSVATDHATVTLPLEISQMPDGVVWLPTNAEGSRVLVDLRALPGDRVTIGQGDAS
jgi:NADH-quinone oxidoreductase subunit G